ncbi:MAG: hypothetical protein ACOC2M_04125 [bacterium]
MMEEKLFARQFLLTKEKFTKPFESWNTLPVGDFSLHTHPFLEVTSIKKDPVHLVLIGYLFDYDPFKRSNMDIVSELAKMDFQSYVKRLGRYTGQYVLLRVEADSFTLISDAGAQREVYYTTDFSAFASQPKLIGQSKELVPHSGEKAKAFYNSVKFKKKTIFIGDTTHWENVKHLSPNHYIDISNQKIARFFPFNKKTEKPLDFVVDEAIKRITGFLKAVEQRHKVALPVTAGYDSRLLFAASLGIDCRYFVFKHRKLNEKHYDIAISRKLLKDQNKPFEVITYNEAPDENIKTVHNRSIDFPRAENTALIYNGYNRLFADYTVLDTIMSELARNRYGNFRKLNAADLAYLNHYKGDAFAVSVYNDWLKANSKAITDNDYNIPDLFYWEEIMGNWAAKSKTEYMLGTEFFSLLNSRELIELLMSVNIRYRNTNNNILYNSIIAKLAKDALKYPMNPSRRTSMQVALQRMKIYDAYRYLKLKLKL